MEICFATFDNRKKMPDGNCCRAFFLGKTNGLFLDELHRSRFSVNIYR
jgi:hypothetical protein